MISDMKSFDEQMRALDERRRAAGISSKELAGAAKVGEVSLSRWRNGHQEPLASVWVRVVNALESLITQRVQTLQRLERQ